MDGDGRWGRGKGGKEKLAWEILELRRGFEWTLEYEIKRESGEVMLGSKGMTKRRREKERERDLSSFLNSILVFTSVYFDFPIDESLLRSRVTSFPSLLSVQGNCKLVAQELDSKVWGGSQRVDQFRFSFNCNRGRIFLFFFLEENSSNFCRVASFTRCTPYSLKRFINRRTVPSFLLNDLLNARSRVSFHTFRSISKIRIFKEIAFQKK